MTFMRRPRAFLSYRHEEPHGWFGRSRYNAQHRAWIRDFAQALGTWNIDVIWDDRLRRLFSPHTKQDPSTIPFVAEVSTLCQLAAQVFIPVLTRGYVERVEGVGGGKGHGTVSEEWKLGTAQLTTGQCEFLAIVREWPIPGHRAPPPPIHDDIAWDYRFVAPSSDEVELLADAMQGIWEVERPLADMPFSDLISLYLEFCTSAFDLKWPGIETWGCDFHRPRFFLDTLKSSGAGTGGNPAAGSQRDLSEAVRTLGIKTVQQNSDERPEIGSEEAAKAEEAAKRLMHSVMTAHVARHRKEFSFAEAAPGGRASNGLYFGPTISGFSHA